jgi:hypothetical protein
MRQVKELQAKMAKVQEELGKAELEASAGGGAVTVVVDGHQNIKSVKISRDAVDLEDISLLEDLVLAAVNEGIKKSRELAQSRLEALTGGLNIPGLM